ncbi:MAG: hypothetical protein ACI9DC_004325 [Gammaproteobacteria bacterium]|jgi:hypothetical protein
MKTTNSPLKLLLSIVGMVLLISACASQDAELIHCSQREGDSEVQRGCGDSVYKEPDNWKESATILPPLPKAENLRPIDAIQASDKYEYLIDRASVVRGSDDVIRYTVVLRAASGLENIFYEGLRCSTNTVRTLGYAGSNNRFRPATNAAWTPLATFGVRGYQYYLESEIMCGEAGFARDADDVVKALDSQFTSGGVRIQGACDGPICDEK